MSGHLYFYLKDNKLFESDSGQEVSISGLQAFMKNGSQWANTMGGIMKVQDVHASLRTGNFYYKVVEFNRQYFLKPFSLTTDDIIDLPQDAMNKAAAEMKYFLSRAEAYKSFGVTHKRGFLLYGPPGNGKSALVARLARELGKSHNVIPFLASDVASAIWGVNEIRSVEPDRPIMVVIEEIDGHQWVNDDELLTFLDGEQSKDHVMFLATTNFYEELPARLRRIGRFDSHVPVENPNPEVRMAYLNRKLPNYDKNILTMLVERTNGYSLAALKEVAVLKECLGVSFEEALVRTAALMHTSASDEERTEQHSKSEAEAAE